jgi:hypothetical protein
MRPEQLAALPEDLLSQLHQAVVELDTVLTLTLIEQISEHDDAVGRVFDALAKKLDYGRLLRLLEEDTNR